MGFDPRDAFLPVRTPDSVGFPAADQAIRQTGAAAEERLASADGRPIPFTTYDGTPLPTYGSQRPNLIGIPKRNHQKGWINNYFANPGVLSLPPLYALGNAPRTIGSVRTPTAFSVNLSMEKDFSLERFRKDMRLELRLEAQNAFNHPIFGTPDNSIDDPNFGTITYTSNLPREGQLGVKVYF